MKNRIFKLITLSILATGYIGCSSDSSSDSYEIIACQNGGTFIDCNCNCLQGYWDNDCSVQITPKSIKITKVTIRLFPALDENNETWDTPLPTTEDVQPDLYFQFIKSPSNIIYDSPTYFENANVANNHVFTLQTPIIVTDLSNPYTISLWDYDSASDDDLMAAQSFFIYENDNDFLQQLQFTTLINQSLLI